MKRFVALTLATGFGSGCLKPAPGTWGSLAAIIAAYGVSAFLGPLAVILGIGFFTLAGVWSANAHEDLTGKKDAGEVVIDEWAGQWLAALPVALISPNTVWPWAAAFAFFRGFDILKPGPIGWLDRSLKGGVGVMADDLLAGIAAAACLYGALYAIH
ncbi:MAG: phosphatidylglycerophosphatase A [Pseudomonadota bacterium]